MSIVGVNNPYSRFVAPQGQKNVTPVGARDVVPLNPTPLGNPNSAVHVTISDRAKALNAAALAGKDQV